jgi:hypothetical protein
MSAIWGNSENIYSLPVLPPLTQSCPSAGPLISPLETLSEVPYDAGVRCRRHGAVLLAAAVGIGLDQVESEEDHRRKNRLAFFNELKLELKARTKEREVTNSEAKAPTTATMPSGLKRGHPSRRLPERVLPASHQNGRAFRNLRTCLSSLRSWSAKPRSCHPSTTPAARAMAAALSEIRRSASKSVATLTSFA